MHAKIIKLDTSLKETEEKVGNEEAIVQQKFEEKYSDLTTFDVEFFFPNTYNPVI